MICGLGKERVKLAGENGTEKQMVGIIADEDGFALFDGATAVGGAHRQFKLYFKIL